MKSVLVIFNGIKFPYYLLEFALARAKEKNATLHALFLKAADEDTAGYGFPNDLDQAETLTDEADAKSDDEKIIRHQIKLTEDTAATENVSCKTELRTNSSLAEILQLSQNAELLCLNAGEDDSPSLLTDNRIDFNDVINQASCPVIMVSEDMLSK
ncbi:MAG: universal stress protein [Chitinophagaceae bacterium]